MAIYVGFKASSALKKEGKKVHQSLQVSQENDLG